jgi:glutamyl-Q tRNA(Asp) synthetase
MSPSLVTRFAPSPTGLLHLGHAYSALFAARAARVAGGRFQLRIEDIDQGRRRPELDVAILEDLGWLGLAWEAPVRRQSEHMADYAAALARLGADGLTYPCFCTRKEIQAEVARSGQAPHGADGPLYPGTCRRLKAGERRARIAAGEPHALRLDAAAAAARAGPLRWHDRGRGPQDADPVVHGDVVLARKDTPTSYHLAVTLDDHIQGVSLVTRGMDLFEATHVHRLLQALLGLDVPAYHHHRLVVGPDGQRLAKRGGALTLRALREAGHTPADVRRLAGAGD